MKRVDLHWILAFAGLLVTIPLASGTFIFIKKGEAPVGPVFDLVPGIGLGIFGLLGGALVIRTALAATGAPPWLRWILAGAWTIQFACLVPTFSVYLLAAPLGLNLPETLKWVVDSGSIGLAALGLCSLFVVATEVTVPALLIAAAYSSKQAADRHSLAKSTIESGGWSLHQRAIIAALRDGPATAEQILNGVLRPDGAHYAHGSLQQALGGLKKRRTITKDDFDDTYRLSEEVETT
jgi:hypothetical protein